MGIEHPRAKDRPTVGMDDVEGGTRERGIFMTLYDFLDKHSSGIGALIFYVVSVVSVAWVLRGR